MSGGVLERQRYEPFGAGGASSLTRYDYTGREKDLQTGLSHYRDREYDPEQGRFLTEDPAGLAGGLNRYSYVANNPLGFNDPFGLSLATFAEGVLTGGVTAILSAAAIGLLFGLIEGATGGAATPLLLALGDLLAVAAAAVVAQIDSILKNYRDCPDQAHYEIGALLGGLLSFG